MAKRRFEMGLKEFLSVQREIICIGGGGHFPSCADVILSARKYSIKGIIEANHEPGSKINGVKIIGTDEDLDKFSGNHFLVTVGFVKTATIRKKLYTKAIEAGLLGSVVVAPDACVAPSVTIDAGTIVMHNALVNSRSRIGCNVIINSKALVEHNCDIGSHSHISPGAIVNGGCRIGSSVLIGSGAILKQGISIGDDVIIGAGAVVIHDIQEQGTWVGNPARRIDA